jgi:hypothetical protein
VKRDPEKSSYDQDLIRKSEYMREEHLDPERVYLLALLRCQVHQGCSSCGILGMHGGLLRNISTPARIRTVIIIGWQSGLAARLHSDDAHWPTLNWLLF